MSSVKFYNETPLSEAREKDPELKMERLEEENKDLKNQLLEVQEYIIDLELEKLMKEGGM